MGDLDNEVIEGLVVSLTDRFSYPFPDCFCAAPSWVVPGLTAIGFGALWSDFSQFVEFLFGSERSILSILEVINFVSLLFLNFLFLLEFVLQYACLHSGLLS